jgi:RNA polymerase sigma factor (sigma-70 family)
MSAFSRFKQNPTNRDAFDTWYRETYPSLFASAFRITFGNRELAEDLCHDAILAFVAGGTFEKLGSEAEAAAYIRRSVVNAHIDAHRKRKRERTMAPVAQDGADSTVVEEISAQTKYRQLLQRLEPVERQLLSMMFAGSPLSEIAAALNISYSSAGVRVHRMRKLINGLDDA